MTHATNWGDYQRLRWLDEHYALDRFYRSTKMSPPPDYRPGSKVWPACDAVLVMYRNGATGGMDGRDHTVTGACVCEYIAGMDWWPLRPNESVWIVPGTLDPMAVSPVEKEKAQ